MLHSSIAGEYVHRLAAYEMQDAPLNLLRTAVSIGTEPFGFVALAHQRSTAVGTEFGKLGTRSARDTFAKLDGSDLGNDFASLLDIYAVSDTDVQQRHLVGVVQGGALDDGTGQKDRLEVGDRSDGARTADLIVDGKHAGERLLGLELVRHGPARGLGREAQAALESGLIDLDDYAVGGIGQRLAGGVPFIDISLNLIDAVADAALVGNRESPALGGPQGLVVGLERQAFRRYVIKRAPKPPVGDFFGIKELERARRGIARICERGLLLCRTFPVQAVECLIRHEDLAAYLELVGTVSVQLHGNVGDAADIVGDIVADDAVAARERPVKPAFTVLEAYRRTVELKFATVGEIRSESLVGTLREGLDLLDAVSIAKGKHGEPVRIVGELAAYSGLRILARTLRLKVASDPLRRGVGRNQFRKRLFKVLQLVHEVIVVIIAYDRGIVHIVPAAVVPDDLTELFDPYFRLFLVHTSIKCQI